MQWHGVNFAEVLPRSNLITNVVQPDTWKQYRVSVATIPRFVGAWLRVDQFSHAAARRSNLQSIELKALLRIN